MKWIHITALFLLFFVIMPCSAHGSGVRIMHDPEGRYTGYKESPDLPGTVDPLQGPMHKIHAGSLTVGGAMGDVLIETGYIVAIESASDPEVKSLFHASLPSLQKNLKEHSVLDALRILAGKPWQFVVDPVHRMISFELPYPYNLDVPRPIQYKRQHNGLVLLGFDVSNDSDASDLQLKNIFANDCQYITRDLTKPWVTREYWCYPSVSTSYTSSVK